MLKFLDHYIFINVNVDSCFNSEAFDLKAISIRFSALFDSPAFDGISSQTIHFSHSCDGLSTGFD
jgi:hypothetical protein